MKGALACALISLPVQGGVSDFNVTTDKTVDSSSLESIVRDVVGRSGANSNDEKAVALFEYLHNTIFHWACPKERGSIGPLKVINVYGWCLCYSQHTVLKALYETAGWPCRYVDWTDPGHTTIEVFYDGRWHYLDVFLKCYFWSKDKTYLVGQEEIAADPSLVLDAAKEGRASRIHLCCGDAPEAVVSGCRSRKVLGDLKGWETCTGRDVGYSTALQLPSGASLRLDWAGEPGGFAVDGKAPTHSCGMKDIVRDSVLGPVAEHYGRRNWSNGRFVYAPDFAKSSDVQDVELLGAKVVDGRLVGGTAVFKAALPYVFVRARVEAVFEGGEGRMWVSVDGGKTWAEVEGDITPHVRQHYEVWVKAELRGTLTRFKLEALVEHNRGALPHLLNGKNRVTITLGSKLPENARARITYKFQEATIRDAARRAHWDGKEISYGPVREVTREIDSTSFSFDLEVGGNTPPRMLSLERAIFGEF